MARKKSRRPFLGYRADPTSNVVPAEQRFVSYKELRLKGIPYSRAHICKMIDAGKFPKPIAFGANRVAFLNSEIDAWLDQLVERRDENLKAFRERIVPKMRAASEARDNA
jgi:prophage regulatory protein